MSLKNWVPLESNPEVLTEFGRALGLSAPIGFVDVFSTDLLDMVPRPVLAVILLFPLTPSLASTEVVGSLDAGGASDPYFVKQTIPNACGTIGLIHAVANAAGDLPLVPTKFLHQFIQKTADPASNTPDSRADALSQDRELDETHAEFAQRGQTEAPSASESVDLHFVAFIHKDGRLYELDGRKDRPIYHKECKPDSLLETSCDVIRSQFMAKDPAELRFTIMALAPAE